MKKIAILASGAGSNAEKIIHYFRDSGDPGVSRVAQVALIVCNNPRAGILEIAQKENLPAWLLEKEKFFHGNGYAEELMETGIDGLVLAGFLWKIPDTLIRAYPNRIINIHPALLPKFGGQGMYGRRVHQAVINQREEESGITIHYVDGHYDNGDIIFQARCPVREDDTAESLAHRVQELEHEFYPRVIAEWAANLPGPAGNPT